MKNDTVKETTAAPIIEAGNASQDAAPITEKAKAKDAIPETFKWLGNTINTRQLIKAMQDAASNAGKVNAIAVKYAGEKQSETEQLGLAPSKGQAKIVGGKASLVPRPGIVNELYSKKLLGDLNDKHGKAAAEKLRDNTKAVDGMIDALALLGVAYRR